MAVKQESSQQLSVLLLGEGNFSFAGALTAMCRLCQPTGRDARVNKNADSEGCASNTALHQTDRNALVRPDISMTHERAREDTFNRTKTKQNVTLDSGLYAREGAESFLSSKAQTLVTQHKQEDIKVNKIEDLILLSGAVLPEAKSALAQRACAYLRWSEVDGGIKLIASSYDSMEEVQRLYPESVPILKRLNEYSSSPLCTVMHEVDALRLCEAFPDEKFDRIIWNHPHLGVEDFRAHQAAMAHFFDSCKACLRENGLVYISLVQGQHERWRVLDSADWNDFELVESPALRAGEFPGYEVRRNKTGATFKATSTQRRLNQPMQSYTHIYRRKTAHVTSSGQSDPEISRSVGELEANGRGVEQTDALPTDLPVSAMVSSPESKVVVCENAKVNGDSRASVYRALVESAVGHSNSEVSDSAGIQNSEATAAATTSKSISARSLDQRSTSVQIDSVVPEISHGGDNVDSAVVSPVVSDPGQHDLDRTDKVPKHKKKKKSKAERKAETDAADNEPPGGYVCEICGKEIPSSRGLKQHIQFVHEQQLYGSEWTPNKPADIKCAKCDNMFAYEKDRDQ
ncbi:hypothetical protein SARC_07146, partial [Sphaeroforma arctica JP610]